jgi:hypothetical protein
MSLDNKQPNYNLFEPTIIELPDFDKKGTGNYYDISKLLFVKNKIVDEKIFKESLALFKEQLATTVLPFFDKIQTLQQVNDEILEKYDWLEWSNYISGQTMFKALIIMKLCNNAAKYRDFSLFYKERINNAIQEGKIEYQDLFNTLVALLDYLDSGKYLEVI